MTGKLIEPGVLIPALIQQGDTVSWIDQPFTDVEGSEYDSGTYTLTYSIAGPTALTKPTTVAQASGWETTISAVQTAALLANAKYWWQATLSGAGLVITVAKGQLRVNPNLALATAGFSGLTPSELALSQWKAALDALSGTSGPPVESYKIGEREMKYRNIPEILAVITRLEAKVINEQTADSIAQGQGNPRKLYARFRSRDSFQ